MTTFTKIPEDQTPCISIDVSRRVAKINRNIYGGFTEYVFIVLSPRQSILIAQLFTMQFANM